MWVLVELENIRNPMQASNLHIFSSIITFFLSAVLKMTQTYTPVISILYLSRKALRTLLLVSS